MGMTCGLLRLARIAGACGADNMLAVSAHGDQLGERRQSDEDRCQRDQPVTRWRCHPCMQVKAHDALDWWYCACLIASKIMPASMLRALRMQWRPAGMLEYLRSTAAG